VALLVERVDIRTDGLNVRLRMDGLTALARAFRWKRMLESGEFATIAELAEREGIAPSYMTRVLRLTFLAPDIVESILDGKQGPGVTLARVLEPFPMEWATQVAFFRETCQKSGAVNSLAPH